MKRYHRFSHLIKKKPILEITPVDEIQLLSIDSQKNIIYDPVDEISIIGKHLQENIKEPIDEIQIIGKQIITNIYEPIDEIAIIGKERAINVYEPIDEIAIIGKELDIENEKINNQGNNNICKFELQIIPDKNKKENKKDKALIALIDNNDSSIEDKDGSDKENIDDNIELNMNENDNKKIKEINKLKMQLEKEKAKIKDLVKKIIELESEMNENKI